MATVQMSTKETIADELSQHQDEHHLRDWGVEIYCSGCDWNHFALGGHQNEFYPDDTAAYKAYDEHLAEAICKRLWGGK
jgi:hypothetical protein